jgi:hypothetical protein
MAKYSADGGAAGEWRGEKKPACEEAGQLGKLLR